MHYSVQPRDWIFVKGYGFLSFAKKLGTNIGKNISKNLSSKYNQKHFDYPKKSGADAFKTVSKTEIQKAAEGTGDLIGGKITGLQKIHNKIIQTQLQMGMIKKYPKKDIYLQKKGRKLLIEWD